MTSIRRQGIPWSLRDPQSTIIFVLGQMLKIMSLSRSKVTRGPDQHGRRSVSVWHAILKHAKPAGRSWGKTCLNWIPAPNRKRKPRTNYFGSSEKVITCSFCQSALSCYIFSPVCSSSSLIHTHFPLQPGSTPFQYYPLWYVNALAPVTTTIVGCGATLILIFHRTLRGMDARTTPQHFAGLAESCFWLISPQPKNWWMNRCRMLCPSLLVGRSPDS